MAQPVYTLAEFLAELGVSRTTFAKYRSAGRLPPPPQTTPGADRSIAVYTHAYLTVCRKMLKLQGLPMPFARAYGLKGGPLGGRPRKAVAVSTT